MYNKNDNETDKLPTRASRNRDLYENIKDTAIDNFDISNNAKVIGSSESNQIDIDMIKKILDTKYNDAPINQKAVSVEITEEIEEVIEVEEKLENTKEYDINTVLTAAKSEQESTYQEDKTKKLNATQFDILRKLENTSHIKVDETIEANSLEEDILNMTGTYESQDVLEDSNTESSLEVKKITEEEIVEESHELLDLINTIVINEEAIREENTRVALDLFEDFSNDKKETEKKIPDSLIVKKDNISSTKVAIDIPRAEMATPPKDDLEKTKSMKSIGINEKEKIKEERSEENFVFQFKEGNETKQIKKTEPSEDLFYTSKTKFKKSDFESLGKDNDKNYLIEILIFVLIVGFVVGMYFFLKTFLNF